MNINHSYEWKLVLLGINHFTIRGGGGGRSGFFVGDEFCLFELHKKQSFVNSTEVNVIYFSYFDNMFFFI